jgi:sarcosine oxidase subunit beta
MDKIVIIGAGIQGLSTAYNIARNNSHSEIIVIEENKVAGKGSSGRSGSMLMKSRENVEKIQLSLYSFERFLNFENEFNEHLFLNQLGFLSLVNERMENRYKIEHALRLKLGVPSIVIPNKDIGKYCKGINCNDIKFGLFGPDDCEINPNQIISAYERQAIALKVKICYDEKAIDIVSNGKNILGIKTNKGLISCNIVINAAGANAKDIGSWLGVKLPIKNTRRSIYYVESESTKYNSGPMVEDAEIEWYYRPMGNQKVLIGMGLEENLIPTDGPNMDFLPEIIKATKYRAIDLYPFKIIGGVSGIRSLTNDKLPIIGPIDEIEGYFNNCGWGGEGIMHSPAGGTIIADWINSTNNYPFDKRKFLLNRFT